MTYLLYLVFLVYVYRKLTKTNKMMASLFNPGYKIEHWVEQCGRGISLDHSRYDWIWIWPGYLEVVGWWDDSQYCLRWTSLSSDGNASVCKFHGRSQDSVLQSRKLSTMYSSSSQQFLEGTGQGTKTDEFLEKFQGREGGGYFQCRAFSEKMQYNFPKMKGGS